MAMGSLGRIKVILEREVPPISSPDPSLEQYTTPAELALVVAQDAMQRGILRGSTVADLASGTCRLGIASLLLGAEKLVAIDVDFRLSRACLEAARRLGLDGRVSFIASRLSGGVGPLRKRAYDIVVTNPPFGVRRRGADWEVLAHALESHTPHVYAILKSGNLKYHSYRAELYGYSTILISTAKFPIQASMPHHRSRVRRVDVDVILFKTAIREGGGYARR
ncbi:MAG: METTL5 family protein [Aeropyrum sp.]|nr:METTL5 family protein [Aeropyrum sp.]